MYQEQSKLELYIELLTQVKHGNCYYSDLRKCTRLSTTMLDQTIAPLLDSGLLKRVKIEDTQGGEKRFGITDRGDQFIDIIRMALNYVE
jgi:DNA-binding HxlR family transcriptional regulator